MHPKIVESFWTDLDFERYEGAELVAHRLTFLWSITGPVTNWAGVFPLNRRAFTGDTGLPFSQLEATMNAFPRAFTVDAASHHALVRNYIRFQIGSGPALARNKMAAAVMKALLVSPQVLAEEVFNLYPELRELRGYASPSQGLAKPLAVAGVPHETPSSAPALPKGLPSPSNPLAKGIPCPQRREEKRGEALAQGSAEGGGSSEVSTPSVEEVIAWGQFDGVPEACCRDFWSWHDSRLWMSGQTRIGRPRNLLKSYFYGWQQRNKNTGARRSDQAGPSEDDIMAALQVEENAGRRAELEAQLKNLRA